jgi:dTDP-4-amino-4,6-dideoxygalactose transaminase
MNIPFNIPHLSGKEIEFMREAITSGHLSGNGSFTQLCHKLIEKTWSGSNVLLTTSCTDALEMSAILLDIKPGDEVIVPSYTFVSTALAFSRQGATIVFADSRNDNPCIDEEKIEDLITSKTKAIVPVHYSGISCNMDKIMTIAAKYKLRVIEDAAHAFGAKYKGKLLGTIGELGCFSFHETKVVHCGEGGMLAINDHNFLKRAEIIWEKGTNRVDFHRGKVQKYEWIDTGSSFLMSDISAAFLYAQLLDASNIINQRKIQWKLYFSSLKELEKDGCITLPVISSDAEINYSEFYLVIHNNEERDQLLNQLNKSGIQALTHYLDLAQSPYIQQHQTGKKNIQVNSNSKRYQETLIRLPLFHNLTSHQIEEITGVIKDFYSKRTDGVC